MSNKSDKVSRFPWVRIFAESTAIVLSILLAFAIDAWWDNSQDRKEEQQILVALRGEYEVHVADFRDMQRTASQMLYGLETIMSHISRPDSQYSLARLDSALHWVLWRGTWDPPNSVLRAIQSSGRVELIQSDSLREGLARWQGIVAEIIDDHLLNLEFMLNSLWPLLAEKEAPMTRGWTYQEPRLHSLVPDDLARTQYENLRGDQQVLGMITTKRNIWSNVSRGYPGGLDEALRLLRLINEQIE